MIMPPSKPGMCPYYTGSNCCLSGASHDDSKCKSYSKWKQYGCANYDALRNGRNYTGKYYVVY